MTRVLLALAGAAAAAYGGLLLLDQGPGDLVGVAAWLAAGVLLHDLVLAPLTIALVVVASRRLPHAWRGPAAAALVVAGSVTLLAVPVLGRFGARADNPSLLDRPYAAGWAVLTGLVLLVVGFWGVVRAHRPGSSLGPRGPG